MSTSTLVEVRTMHPYGFRSGKWARLVVSDTRLDGRPTWLVAFPDGVTDVWVADDEQGEYEVREVPC